MSLVALLAILLLMLAVFVFFRSNLWLNSDTAFTVMFAREFLAGTVQDGLWYSGNTVHISTVLAIPFAALIADDLLVQNIYQVVNSILLLVSIIYYGKNALRNDAYLLLAIVLFSGISLSWYTMMFAMCDYNQPVRMLFWTLGASFALHDGIKRGRKRKAAISLFILAAALFVSILGGFQAFQSVVIPLAAAGAYACLESGGFRSGAMLRLMRKRANVAIAAVLVAAVVIGAVLSRQYSALLNVAGNKELTTFASEYSTVVSNIGINIQGFLQFCGLTLAVPLFSAKGLLNILRFFVMLCLIVFIPIWELAHFKSLEKGERFLAIFALVHVFEIVLVLNLTEGPIDGWQSARYHITSYVLLIAVSCNRLYKWLCSARSSLFAVTAVVILVAFSVSTTLSTAGLFNSGNYGEALSEKQGVAAFLESQGLTYGYATYWNACNNTILSNERVKVRPVGVAAGKAYPNLTCASSSWFGAGAPELQRTFLMLTAEELKSFAPDGLAATSLGVPESIMEYGNFTVLVYPCNIV